MKSRDIRNKKINTYMAFAIVLSSSIFAIYLTGESLSADLVLEVEAKTINVDAGGGNASFPFMGYSPQILEIDRGQTVVWKNPSTVSEPHTVTFYTDSEFLPPLVVPYNISGNSKLNPAIPASNVEPTIIDDIAHPNNKLIMVDNARASSPVVIDSSGTNVTYLPPNANYTFSGDELYVNSGYIWPKGHSPPGAPPLTSFALTFESTGTYNYICVIHPWMTGKVVVK